MSRYPSLSSSGSRQSGSPSLSLSMGLSPLFLGLVPQASSIVSDQLSLSSLNLIQLFEQYNDYKSLGYSTLDIESHIHKITSLPIYLVIMILLGSILMFNTSYNKSKVANLVIGILLSVFIYYINYFFNLMGINERIPVILSVWFPFIILILLSGIGLVKINEK